MSKIRIKRGRRAASASTRRLEHRDGSVSVPLDEETLEIFQKQEEAFREKFGRDPGPDDPIFFNPDADEPEPLPESVETEIEEIMVELLEQNDVDPAFIYAYKKVGVLVTEENVGVVSLADRIAWDKAVDEYRREN